MMRREITLPEELERQIDELVARGEFTSFDSAVQELIRLGIAYLRAGRSGAVPPGQVPSPERPNIPDPTRDILRF